MLHGIRSCLRPGRRNRGSPSFTFFLRRRERRSRSGHRTPPILVSKKPARAASRPLAPPALPSPQLGRVGPNVQLSPRRRPGLERGTQRATGHGEEGTTSAPGGRRPRSNPARARLCSPPGKRVDPTLRPRGSARRGQSRAQRPSRT